MNQQTEMKKVKDRIAALAAKTTDNGCSESEAMTAIAMVGKLLTQYNLTMNEVLMRDETYLTKTLNTGRIQRHPIDSCVMVIAEFCQTRVWTALRNEKGKKTRFYYFFGTESDVDMSIYLTEMIKGSLNQELNAFKNSPAYRASGKHGKTVSYSFSKGMTSRINSRLRELTAANKEDIKLSTGTSLIVLKGQLLKENFEKLGMRLRAGGSSARIRDNGAYAKGQEAGARVNLSRPVGYNRDTILKIGSR